MKTIKIESFKDALKEFAPPGDGAKGLKGIDALPPACFAKLPSTGEVIRIDKGVSGYSQYKHNTTGEKMFPSDEEVDAMNAQMGVSPEAADAMMAGSMFGWGVGAVTDFTESIAKAIDFLVSEDANLVRRFEQLLNNSGITTWSDESGDWDHVWSVAHEEGYLELLSALEALANKLELEYLVRTFSSEDGKYTKFGIQSGEGMPESMSATRGEDVGFVSALEQAYRLLDAEYDNLMGMTKVDVEAYLLGAVKDLTPEEAEQVADIATGDEDVVGGMDCRHGCSDHNFGCSYECPHGKGESVDVEAMIDAELNRCEELTTEKQGEHDESNE